MDIAVYFADIAQLMNVEEALRTLDIQRVPSAATASVFWDSASSREYLGNLFALGEMAKCEQEPARASRLYFGQEFCQYLIPSASEVETAFGFARQLGWDFTYVTGYVTDKALSQVRRNLDFLAQRDDEVEVVVNDWGVLAVVARDYPTLQPVLGRLLVKQPRLGRYSSPETPPPVQMEGLDAVEEELRDRQLYAVQGLSLSNEVLRNELKRLRVKRVDIDIAPQGVNIDPVTWQFEFSCYYPWGYLAGGRNCSTAGTVDPKRRYVVSDEPCPRPCRTVNRCAVARFKEVTVQRGNSLFILHSGYAARYLTGDLPVNRIVFQPYIPI